MNTHAITRMYQGLYEQRAIYLSDAESARDLSLLKSLNITAVLSVAKQFKINYPQTLVEEHLYIPAIDTEDYDIQSIFDQTFQFIDSMHLKRNVLIHCALGVSRSAAVFIAYRIRKHGQSLQNALSSAVKRRPIINPNKGFIQALERYSKIYHNYGQYGQIQRDRIKKSRSSLARKKSLPEKRQLQYQNIEQKQKDFVPGHKKVEQTAELTQLTQIYIKKQQIQKKINQLQSYYRELNKGRLKLKKLNSFEQKGEIFLDGKCIKHHSAQI